MQAGLHRVLQGRFLRQLGGGHTLLAQLGHRQQGGLLEIRVGLYTGHQPRHQLVAALELHVDIAPGSAHLVAITDQPVVDPDAGDGDQNQQNADDSHRPSINVLHANR